MRGIVVLRLSGEFGRNMLVKYKRFGLGQVDGDDMAGGIDDLSSIDTSSLSMGTDFSSILLPSLAPSEDTLANLSMGTSIPPLNPSLPSSFNTSNVNSQISTSTLATVGSNIGTALAKTFATNQQINALTQSSSLLMSQLFSGIGTLLPWVIGGVIVVALLDHK